MREALPRACAGKALGGLHSREAAPGSRQATAVWATCAGVDLGAEQCCHDFTVRFCDSFNGGADYLRGAFVGAGVHQAFCFNFEGFCGGEFLAENGLHQGGLPDISAVLLDDDSLEGFYGGRAHEQGMLDGYGALVSFGGKILEEIGLFLGGFPDSLAGVVGNGVLEGFDAGPTTEQALPEELGAFEGLCGDPPDPGGGACGFLRWFCLKPGWRQGLRGVRVGEASHPGPGGGAAATEHRRQEHQMQQALVSIIELLMSVVASLAGDDNPVKQQMAGIRGLLGVLRAGQDAGQAEEQQQQHPWRQVHFEEPDVTFFQASDWKPNTVKGGKGKTEIAEGKGKGKLPGVAGGKGQGEGKGAKAKASAGGEGKQPSSRWPSTTLASRARLQRRRGRQPRQSSGARTGAAASWTTTRCRRRAPQGSSGSRSPPSTPSSPCTWRPRPEASAT